MSTRRALTLIVFALVVAAVFVVVAAQKVSTAHEQSTHRTFVLRLATTPNEERDLVGVHNLSFNRGLNTAAQHHAEVMCLQNFLHHAPDITEGAPEGWQIVGENVGRTNVDHSGKVGKLRRAFNSSASHRALIVDPRFTLIGFGTCRGGGFRYVVYRFAG